MTLSFFTSEGRISAFGFTQGCREVAHSETFRAEALYEDGRYVARLWDNLSGFIIENLVTVRASDARKQLDDWCRQHGLKKD